MDCEQKDMIGQRLATRSKSQFFYWTTGVNSFHLENTLLSTNFYCCFVTNYSFVKTALAQITNIDHQHQPLPLFQKRDDHTKFHWIDYPSNNAFNYCDPFLHCTGLFSSLQVYNIPTLSVIQHSTYHHQRQLDWYWLLIVVWSCDKTTLFHPYQPSLYSSLFRCILHTHTLSSVNILHHIKVCMQKQVVMIRKRVTLQINVTNNKQQQ